MSTPETDLADDLLVGAEEIAAFFGDKWTARRVYHLAEAGAIPVIRRPGTKLLFARKSVLRAAFSHPEPSAPEVQHRIKMGVEGPVYRGQS